MDSSSSFPDDPLVIELDEKSMRIGLSGIVTGVITWSMGLRKLPDETWSDNVVVVLGWWVNATLRLLRGESSTEYMFFMEGPYAGICGFHDNLIYCSFVDRHVSTRVLASSVITPALFAKQIVKASEIAIRFCCDHSLASSDINDLEVGTISLRTMTEKL